MANLTTGLTGIVKSIKPVIKDDEHETWTNDKGVTFYKHWLEIDDKKGKKPVLTKDPIPWYKEGTAVQYTLETLPDGKFNFSEIKKPEGDEGKKAHIKDAYPKTEFKSSYNDPTVVAQFVRSQALELTIKLFQLIKYSPPTEDSITSNVNFIEKWIMNGVTGRDVAWNRVMCIKSAIESFEWLNTLFPDGDDPAQNKVTAKLIKLADKFYAEIEKIK